jgi:hypothetical protein
MYSKVLGHLKDLGQDQITVSCLALTETFTLLLLQAQLNNNVTTRGSR